MGAVVPAALLALYGWGVVRVSAAAPDGRRARRAPGRGDAARPPRGRTARVARRAPWPWLRTLAFAAGCALLAAALAGPIEARSDGDLRWHMVQHLLVATAAPALLALGAPVRLALAALPPAGRRALGHALHRPLVRLLAHPAVAAALAAGTMVVVHLTSLFDAAATAPLLHATEHAALFWTALLAWMAVLAVDPLPHRPDAVGALAWISVTMVAMTGVGAALATDDHARYAHYPSVAAQHDAGTIMWLGGALLLVPAAVGVSMWALDREERRQRRREAALDATRAEAGR